MIKEGAGYVPPCPEDMQFSRADLERLQAIADKRGKYRAYGARSDGWGRGYNPNAILVGLLGEDALCAFLNRRLRTSLSPDSRLLPKGDAYDVNVRGYRIEVKTCRRGGRNLVRRFDDGSIRAVKPVDAFVFAEWDRNTLTVYLRGWIKERDVTDPDRGGRFERSPVGEHWNLNVPSERLKPMKRLLSVLRSLE